MSNPITAARVLELVRQGATPEQLEHEAGDRTRLAQALWVLVREGHGGAVSLERRVLGLLQGEVVGTADFLRILQQLAAASPPWLTTDSPRVDGLAYPGWSSELEWLLRGTLGGAKEETTLGTAELPEPLLSSLRFALRRRGVATELPTGALERFARGFLLRADFCPEQFEGWENVWTAEQFGTAAWGQVDAVQEIGVTCAHLAPLVPFASTEQLMKGLPKLVWRDRVVKEWLASRRGDVDCHHRAAEVEQLLALLPARPEPLPRLAEAMSALPSQAVERARDLLGPLVDQTRRDYRWKLEDALAQLSPDEFLPVLRVTAGRMEGTAVEDLCRHFARRADLPMAAAYWWSKGDLITVAAIDRALGAAALPALLSRLDGGWVSTEARRFLLERMVEHDPVQTWPRLAALAGDRELEELVARGLAKAWGAGAAAVRDWVEARLSTTHRAVALQVLIFHPDLALTGALEALGRRELSTRDRQLLETALAAPKALAPPRARAGRRLQLRPLAELGAPVESLRLAAEGQVLCAATANEIHLWRERDHVVIGGLADEEGDSIPADFPELSPEGEWLLTVESERNTVGVFRPWESTARLGQLETDDGLMKVVPLADGRAFTLCQAHTAVSPLTLWDLRSGKETRHRIPGFPADLEPLDESRYLLGRSDGAVELRALARGKVLQKLREGSDESDGILSLSVGDGGRLAAAVLRTGTLLVWDLSGPKARLLQEHAPRSAGGEFPVVLADPGSRWAVMAEAGVVRVFEGGLPSRSLPVEGEQPMLAFVRPGVLAVAGEQLDLWELGGEHLGTAELAVTALAATAGRVVMGDAKGGVHELVWDQVSP